MPEMLAQRIFHRADYQSGCHSVDSRARAGGIQMTEHEINAAIAEVMGWKDVRLERVEHASLPNGLPTLIGFNPKANCRQFVPYFHSDLNACHEAEEVLQFDHYPRRERYHEYLHQMILKEGIERPLISASAPQRCEAILRTIGKWKE